jgi:hypothetical protein
MRKREGIEPRNVHTVGADLVNNREGHIKRVYGHDAGEPTGVQDRSTSPWQSRELGRSAGLLSPRGRVAQPVRVCLESLLSGEAANHEVNHRHMNHGFAGLR